MLEKKREGGVAYMNDSQESPGEEGSTLKLELLKRIEEMLMTGIQEELCLWKVRLKETEKGKDGRKQYLVLFLFNSFCCFGFNFMPQCHAW